uniref:Methenyltetrahydrofolate synthase domain-containing protein n=1 Tax=Lygus hesperus TaxID=30085 RepID=A0A0A9WD96_LYGHE
MSAENCKQPEAMLVNQAEHSAEPGDNIPVLETIDINEMQPNVDKVVHVTKIYIPTIEPESSVTGPLVVANEAIPKTVNSEVSSPHVVVETDALTLAGSVVNVPSENAGEIVEIQLQPTYPAAHPLPDVTVDVDRSEKIGEIVPITIQPAYPMAHTADDHISSEIVVIPAYPAAHLSVPAPILEESVPTVQIKPDLVQYGTTVTDGSPAMSEVNSSLAEPLYPAAHPLPISAAELNNDDGMSEISLPKVVDTGASSQVFGESATANGTSSSVNVIIQPRNTSRKRGIVLTVVLLVLLISTFAVWGVFKFVLKDSPIT